MRRSKSFMLLACGFTAIIIGVVLVVAIPLVVKGQLNKKLSLSSKDATAYSIWVSPTHPTDKDTWGDGATITMNLYIYNVTNPEGMRTNWEMPALNRVGPFTYREYRENFDAEWEDDNKVVSFTNRKWWVYQGGHSEDEVVTFINPALAAAIDKLKFTPRPQDTLDTIINAIRGMGWDVTWTNSSRAGDLAFGYVDILLKYLQMTAGPTLIPTDTIKLLDNSSTTTAHNRSKQYTGVGDISKRMQFKSWAGYDSLNWWHSDYARTLRGTDGTQFHPGVKKTDILEVFSDQLYRSITMKFTEEVKGYKDITLYRFRIAPENWQSGGVNSNNTGYTTRLGGLINLTSVKDLPPVFGAPIFISSPYFLGADNWFLDRVQIADYAHLTAKPDDVTTFIDVEPITGIIMGAAQRVQINTLMQNLPPVNATTNTRFTVTPLIVLDETVTFDDKFNDYLHKQLSTRKTALTLGYTLGIILCVVGLGSAVTSIWFHRRSQYSSVQH